MRIKKRDLLYFVSSILVVLLHNDYSSIYKINKIPINTTIQLINDICCYALTRVAMPCFLFFSGLLFYNNINTYSDLFHKIKNRIYTVVMPFFVWNIISMIWSYSLSTIPFIKDNLAVRDTFSLSLENIYEGLFFSKYNMHNWYLKQLIIFIIISPIVYYIIQNKKSGLLFVIVIFGMYICKINLPIYQQEFTGICYFLGAYIGKNYYEEFVRFSEDENRKRWYEAIIYFVICASLQMFVYINNMKNDTAGIFWLISSLCFWLIINAAPIENIKYSQFSFFIYLSHFIVAPCVNKLIWLVLPHNNFFMLFTLFGGSFISVLIIVLVGCFIKKHTKPLWFVLTGEK